MKSSTSLLANRILVIDDNPAIHEDFRKILTPQTTSTTSLQEAEALLFGQTAEASHAPVENYQVDSAYQGQEGLRMIEQAAQQGHPYALAFVDVRMPPGWDGVETIERTWQKFPELQVVICTAYSDYTWSNMMASLGHTDNLLILKKPFDPIEVLQMAHSLTRKWLLARQVHTHIQELDGLVQSRTRHLQEANEALQREIAERARTQESLRCSEERFAKAFRANPVPLTLQNALDQRYVDVNDSFLQLLDCKRESVLGRTPAELNLFPQMEMLREILEVLSSRRTVHDLQAELRSGNGKKVTVLISAESLELGNQPHCLMSLQDITERLNIEEQLRQAQKMEAVGQIAAGVSHDFNNILTVIQGHADLQLNMADLDESLRDSLHEISGAANRASSLTRQLLAFSRKQMLYRRPLDVGRTLDDLGKMLRRVLGETIMLRIECAKDLPPVLADAVNFEQIIINLAVNARDAMSNGGPLTIGAELAEIDAAYQDRVPDALIGNFVRLSVADAGEGMDEAVRRRLFEPFFTTKEVGKGTGLGLATVYGIVKQHQGWIEVESTPDIGTVFHVFLPVANGQTGNAEQSGARFIYSAGAQSRTILLVEDEAPVREMASKILKRLGYQVVTAENGPEALALWPQHRGKIDLLLTDMVMPGGMTGRELADRLLREAPQMPVIYSTGYSVDLLNSGVNLIEGGECLLKPYDASTLVGAVNKVFELATGKPKPGNEPVRGAKVARWSSSHHQK